MHGYSYRKRLIPTIPEILFAHIQTEKRVIKKEPAELGLISMIYYIVYFKNAVKLQSHCRQVPT